MQLDPSNRSAVVDFIRSQGTAVLATVGPDGRPEAALVDVAVDDHGTVVLVTRNDARKALNIAAAPNVALVVGLAGTVTLQLEGTAQVHRDGEPRQRYGTLMVEAFRGSRALQDGWSVIAVRPRWAKAYDVTATPAASASADWS